MTVGGLFSGIGGIEKGFEQAGFTIKYGLELNKYAVKTLKHNVSYTVYEEDITKVEYLPKVDILVGGFPCQAFSIAGLKKGFEDPRGKLFFEILRIIDIVNPEIIFLENIKNILYIDKGRTLENILHLLAEKGFYVQYKNLNSKDYGGVPQNRDRVYFVGFKDKKKYIDFCFPNKIERKSLIDILDKTTEDKYYINNMKIYPYAKEFIKEKFIPYRKGYGLKLETIKSCKCSPALVTAGGGGSVHILRDDKDIRKLTPEEGLRLQANDDLKFPEDISLTQRYNMIGNSVTVSVVRRIAENIKKIL